MDAVARLRAAGFPAAEDECRRLRDHAPDDATFATWLERRLTGEPLEWIVGVVDFCGHRLQIGPGVYVPRPQTEALARRAADLAAGGTAIDLATGCGAIAVVVAERAARVLATELDAVAARWAERNGVEVYVGDLYAPLPSVTADVVTANVPYVPTAAIDLLPRDIRQHEPPAALDGGADGLDLARRVIAGAPAVLRPAGWLLLEIGGEQEPAVRAALRASGFDAVESWVDEEDNLRGVAARLA